MRPARLLSAALFLSLNVSLAYAANFSSDRSQQSLPPLVQPDPGIPMGEHLEYEVFWMGVPIGIGELHVQEKILVEGREAFHLVAVARTNDFLSKLYPVRDEVHSWVDAEHLTSLQFEKKVSEGRYRADEIVQYDGAAKKGHYESLKNGTQKTFDVSVPIQDILSAFYWARRQPMSPGQTLKTTVNSDEKDWGLEIHVLRREKKEVRGAGVIDTLVIEPKTRLKGVLERRGRVIVYLKNDAARTPALVTFHTSYGIIVGVLKDRS